jgi:GNAT superfamily N-acetyltransferase
MILPTIEADISEMFAVINDSAIAYRGHIPADVWSEPYMPLSELRAEIADGVVFSKYVENGAILGVMGIQKVRDVHLIRHAYVRTASRGKGVGGKLLEHLAQGVEGEILIGTWRAATWAIAFYEKHGYALVGEKEKNRLLHSYWNVSDRQIETSVVLRLV